MENFISVTIPGRTAKKAIINKMIASASGHLQESEPNYGVFESDDLGKSKPTCPSGISTARPVP